jgi:hypothetical protein
VGEGEVALLPKGVIVRASIRKTRLARAKKDPSQSTGLSRSDKGSVVTAGRQVGRSDFSEERGFDVFVLGESTMLCYFSVAIKSRLAGWDYPPQITPGSVALV